MLRKLFYSGGTPEDVDATKKMEEEDGEFAEMVVQLDRFEERLKDTINKLSRHCQAICEMVASSRDLGVCVHELYGVERNELQAEADAESRKLVADIAAFRTNSIAPLQTILAGIPQLKLRCDHRKSAQSVMLRYQLKVEVLQAVTRHETSRLRRNRAKHQVALVRFNEINDEVLADVAAVLANDLPEIAGQTIEKLLVQHQSMATKWMQAEVSSIQNRFTSSRKTLTNTCVEQVDEKEICEDPSDCDNNGNNNADDIHAEDPATATSVRPSSPCTQTATASPKKFQAQGDTHILPKHVLNQERSICPRKKHVAGTRTWNLHRYIKDSMANGLDLKDCIQLPEGCQLDEWIAVHVIDFFNEISLLFGTISEFCTHTSCPQMSAGPCYTYLWADGVQQVTPITLPASDYVSRLLTWVEEQLDDPKIFPEVYAADDSGEVNPTFMRAACNILKRMFRVYAHMYHNHLQSYVALHAETHLNFCFKRFILFVRQFGLIEQRELNALRKLIQTLA